jgi:hypothetical protein
MSFDEIVNVEVMNRHRCIACLHFIAVISLDPKEHWSHGMPVSDDAHES